MKKQSIQIILSIILVLGLAVTALAATGSIKVLDANGRTVDTIPVSGKDGEVKDVDSILLDEGYQPSKLIRTQRYLNLSSNRHTTVTVSYLAGGQGPVLPWQDYFFPLDYHQVTHWDPVWGSYTYPPYETYASYWNYDANAYARYVAYYNDLRNGKTDASLRSDWFKEGQVDQSQVYYKYIVGGEGSSFEPDRKLTRAEAATMFSRLLAQDQAITAQANAYTDVKPGDWYHDAISYTTGRGLVIADINGPYRPNDPISSQDFQQMLNQAIDKLGRGVSYHRLTGPYVTRREAVHLINTATGRQPDGDYIAKHITSPFVDVLANTGDYQELMAAATTYIELEWHNGNTGWQTHIEK